MLRERARSVAQRQTLKPCAPRHARSVLNKITPEKFDRLMEQLLDLGINSAEALKDTISLIFDKVSSLACPLLPSLVL